MEIYYGDWFGFTDGLYPNQVPKTLKKFPFISGLQKRGTFIKLTSSVDGEKNAINSVIIG